MSRNSSTSGNELPSFLTPASGSYPQTTVDEPVFRSAQPFESSDAKSLGGLDMVGLSRAAPSSIPSFSSASGIFSPTIGHSKPVYRDLRLTDSMGKSVAPGAFRSASGPSVCPQPMPVIYEANMSFECCGLWVKFGKPCGSRSPPTPTSRPPRNVAAFTDTAKSKDASSRCT